MAVTAVFLKDLLDLPIGELIAKIQAYQQEQGRNLLNEQDEMGRTLIHHLVQSIYYYYHPQSFDLILQNNPDLMIRDELGNTALHVAVYAYRDLHEYTHETVTVFVKLLTYASQNSFDFSILNDIGLTVIHCAVTNGEVPNNPDFNAVKQLIQNVPGIDLDVLSQEGTTPLYRAIHHSYFEAGKLLLEAGADVTRLENSKFSIINELNYIVSELEYRVIDQKWDVERVNLRTVEGMRLLSELFFVQLYDKAFILYFASKPEDADAEKAFELFSKISKKSTKYADAQYYLSKIVCFNSNYTPASFEDETEENCKARIAAMLPYLQEAAEFGHALAINELAGYKKMLMGPGISTEKNSKAQLRSLFWTELKATVPQDNSSESSYTASSPKFNS